MSRSSFGGRHELGQNFLTNRATIASIVDLVDSTEGSILEIGAGDGHLTRPLSRLGRQLTAVEIDEYRGERLRSRARGASVVIGDVLRLPFDADVVVGNVPFHLTTPILRKLLREPAWNDAVLLTQWEVARKRASVGGSTMMTAQSGPRFTFELVGRVPARHFAPMPSVDGGLLRISRRREPLVPRREEKAYTRFVRATFTGRGNTLARIVSRAAGIDAGAAKKSLARAGVPARALPRDLSATQWARLWREVRRQPGR